MANNLLVVYDADTKLVRMVVDHPNEDAYEWECWTKAEAPVKSMVVSKTQFGEAHMFAANIQDHVTEHG